MPASGQFPASGSGLVTIQLSLASAKVVSKVTELSLWKVSPTMTRGAKKISAAALKPQQSENWCQKKASKKDTTSDTDKKKVIKKDKKEKAEKKEKKQKKKMLAQKEVENLAELGKEVGEDDIRRTPDGRKKIQAMIARLHELDQKAFPQTPCFDDAGRCRMKWEGLLEASGRAMESMSLGFI